MSLIRKPSELTIQTKIKALIYGQAGSGKSTLALSAPKPLMLDFDGGVHRVNYAHQTPTVQVSSWEDCESVLKEDLKDFESLIIDTGGKMLDYMAEYIIRKNPKMGRSNGALTLQGFGERKGMFRQFCRSIMIMNKHLVFVAHRDTQKINEEYRYVPLFGGSSYDDLVTDLDLVGYLEAVGKKRVMTFDPSDRNDGKNTCNLPATIDLPIVVDVSGNGLANTFLATQVIAPYIANLEARVKTASAYDKVVKEIKDNIELITDEVSANDFIDRIDFFDHTGNSKAVAGKLLAEKAKVLKLKLNKESKRYERG
jgi:energy-coupling factor transporter ATP-binding protein EcfA2